MLFDGKNVVITGAGSGIGRALAMRFSEEGANIILLGRTLSKLEETAALLGGRRVEVFQADVSDWVSMDAAAKSVGKQFGGVDILINNAGVWVDGPLSSTPPEQVSAVISSNCAGTILSTRAFLNSLKKRRGLIVNVSSIFALEESAGTSVYTSSKSAVRSFSHVLRKELAPSGVRVSVLVPGSVYSYAVSQPSEGELLKTRSVSLNDVSDAVIFIASRPPHANVDELVMTPMGASEGILGHFKNLIE